MPRSISRKPAFDRASFVAYAGVGAAIAFIAAMTFGAIDAPAHRAYPSVTAQGEAPTHVVSAATSAEDALVR